MSRFITFLFDKNIPLPYLIGRIWYNHILMRVIGMLKMRKFGRVSCHHTARIKCPSKIHVVKDGFLSIGRNCYVDALSVDGIRCEGRVSFGIATTISCSSKLDNLGKGMIIHNGSGLGTHGFYGCAGGIEIGENVMIGNFVSMHSENHNFERVDIPMSKQGVNRKGIKIGNDCWIGAKATFLDGSVLGDGCVVAAGSVVRGEIPPYSVVAGVPAKIIKSRIHK